MIVSFWFLLTLDIHPGQRARKTSLVVNRPCWVRVLFCPSYYWKGFSVLGRRSGSSPGNTVPNSLQLEECCSNDAEEAASPTAGLLLGRGLHDLV